MDVMSPQQEHLGPGRSSSVSGENRGFAAAADSKKKMKSLAQRRQSAPSLIFVKALSRSRSASSLLNGTGSLGLWKHLLIQDNAVSQNLVIKPSLVQY
ncbi:hypothetical protein WISP_14838 [Willisornis vidua]|uniref:Uncharacterized protein n=1 Tax=Willisornis vidua TaxID=1566151 RepID=A0ABQ9DWG4_9PASS|nr:hypothetical protein WISP_14838 [Willisornis vidua]